MCESSVAGGATNHTACLTGTSGHSPNVHRVDHAVTFIAVVDDRPNHARMRTQHGQRYDRAAELLAKYFQPMPLTPTHAFLSYVIDQRAVICLLLPARMPAATPTSAGATVPCPRPRYHNRWAFAFGTHRAARARWHHLTRRRLPWSVWCPVYL
jgi:hypothetical protein